MKGELAELREEYYQHQLAQPGLSPDERAILTYKSQIKPERKPRHTRLASVAQQLYTELANLPEDQLLAEYYGAPALAQVHKLRSQKAKEKARHKLLALAKK
jgi:hypothetical protein